MSLNTTAATWVALSTPTAANLNLEIRDAVNGIQASWGTYTPVVTSTGTAPTLGTGHTETGTTQRIGKTIDATIEVVFGSAGFAAGTGSYGFSLPVAATTAAVAGGRIIGDGFFLDASTGTFYHVKAVASTSTVTRLVLDGSTALVGATAPVVPAVNDQIRLVLRYEAA